MCIVVEYHTNEEQPPIFVGFRCLLKQIQSKLLQKYLPVIQSVICFQTFRR